MALLASRRRSSYTTETTSLTALTAPSSPMTRSYSHNVAMHRVTQRTFRPATYQTREELDAFFGTTKAQNRHHRLRVREGDRVYYDTLEREEWRELLGAQTPDRAEQRRDSVGSIVSADADSPVTVAFAERRASEGGVMSPLSSFFNDVGLHQDHRRLKRTSSTLAKSVAPLTESNRPGWVAVSASKRRQSDYSVESGEMLPTRRLARTRAPDMLLLASSGRRHSLQSTAADERIVAEPPAQLEGRRGTFGGDLAAEESSPSSAAMEYIDSPSTDSKVSAKPGLRHTASLIEFRRPGFSTSDRPPMLRHRSQAENIAPHSAAPSMRRYDSSCSLDLSSSFAPEHSRYTTALTPRTGARKFDASRKALRSASESPPVRPAAISPLPPPSDPYLKSAGPTKPTRRFAELRTGAHVYDGIDIPCASIHLHSDPEDNEPPAVTLGSAKLRVKKLKKPAGDDTRTMEARTGLSRWFTSLGK